MFCVPSILHIIWLGVYPYVPCTINPPYYMAWCISILPKFLYILCRYCLYLRSFLIFQTSSLADIGVQVNISITKFYKKKNMERSKISIAQLFRSSKYIVFVLLLFLLTRLKLRFYNLLFQMKVNTTDILCIHVAPQATSKSQYIFVNL